MRVDRLPVGDWVVDLVNTLNQTYGIEEKIERNKSTSSGEPWWHGVVGSRNINSTEGIDLRVQRDGPQPAFVSPPNAKPMDVTARDVVEVFELLIFTPLHEMTEARLARIQRICATSLRR